MAPFPEDEIMTIKRLEVALKKSDFKLLKEGAYKLHEKYHSHHHFEYPDLLQIILDEVEANYAVPPEIKDILIPTIKDILNQDNQPGQKVSSLTSLSYGINSSFEEKQTEIKKPEFEKIERPKETEQPQEEFIKPFQEFTPIKPVETVQEEPQKIDEPEIFEIPEENFEPNTNLSSFAQTYDVEPTEDIVTGDPVMIQQNFFDKTVEQPSLQAFGQPTQPTEELTAPSEEPIETVEEVIEPINNEPIEYLSSVENNSFEAFEQQEQKEEIYTPREIEQPIEEIKENYEEKVLMPQEPEVYAGNEACEAAPGVKQKSVAIFFGQDSSGEKVKNITKYRELIHRQKDFSLDEIIGLINEIKTQADTNVSELQIFLEKLKPTEHHINLITNSQSANLIDLFKQSEITYSVFNFSEDKRINLLSLLGLTNLYKCKECDSEYLDSSEKISPFILQCPKCKGAMLPDLYTTKGEINLDYYNSSVIALANSDIWLLVHPSLNEKLTLNMLRSALKVSSKVEEIYIVEKDINIRETYKKLFEDINPNIKINNSLNVIEDFFSSI